MGELTTIAAVGAHLPKLVASASIAEEGKLGSALDPYSIAFVGGRCGEHALVLTFGIHGVEDTVALVRATTQAKIADVILPELTEDEQGYFRRGRNAHTHAAPKSATRQEYAKATGFETLFGALYLLGRKDRLMELFSICMEE